MNTLKDDGGDNPFVESTDGVRLPLVRGFSKSHILCDELAFATSPYARRGLLYDAWRRLCGQPSTP